MSEQSERAQIVAALDPTEVYVGDDGDPMLRLRTAEELADAALAAIPDGWAKVDGAWIRLAASPRWQQTRRKAPRTHASTRTSGTRRDRGFSYREEQNMSESVEDFAAEIAALIDQEHTYETSAEATRDAAVAAFNFVAGKLGITGFQAGWAALTAYTQTLHIEGPILVLRGENLLYPQYDIPAKVDDWITECGEWLAEQAQEKLAKDAEVAHPKVLAHWQHLAAGGSLREVGAAVGLSHTAVKFIAHGRPAVVPKEAT